MQGSLEAKLWVNPTNFPITDINGKTVEDLPKIGSKWVHSNKRIYIVTGYTWLGDTDEWGIVHIRSNCPVTMTRSFRNCVEEEHFTALQYYECLCCGKHTAYEVTELEQIPIPQHKDDDFFVSGMTHTLCDNCQVDYETSDQQAHNLQLRQKV